MTLNILRSNLNDTNISATVKYKVLRVYQIGTSLAILSNTIQQLRRVGSPSASTEQMSAALSVTNATNNLNLNTRPSMVSNK